MAKEAKSAPPTRKIIDVAAPGKSQPASTAKPIIVTNRPILKDPMMVDESSSDSSSAEMSRVGKSVNIEPLTQAKDADASPPDEIKPAESKIVIKPLEAPEDKAAKKSPKAAKIVITEPAESKDEAKKPVGKPIAELTKKPAEPPVEPPAEPATAPAVQEEPSSEVKDTPAEAPAPETPSPAEQSAETTDSSKTETPEPQAETTESADLDENSEPGNDQIAPNKLLDETKKKEEEAKAAQTAELEKTIESKKYFLPINALEKRRGNRRAILLLLLVILVTLAWLDVVMDAGIIKIHGIQPLTNYFN